MEAENYKSQNDSFKQTILEHHRHCIKMASQLIQVERDDLLRWINSVDAFAMALSSHILEHDEIKDKFENNEITINKVFIEYEKHYNSLKKMLAEDHVINNDKLIKKYVTQLLKFVREKFVIITMLLHKKHYFEEAAYRDSME